MKKIVTLFAIMAILFSCKNEVKKADEKSEALNKTGAQLYLSGKLTEQLKDSLFSVHDKLDAYRSSF